MQARTDRSTITDSTAKGPHTPGCCPPPWYSGRGRLPPPKAAAESGRGSPPPGNVRMVSSAKHGVSDGPPWTPALWGGIQPGPRRNTFRAAWCNPTAFQRKGGSAGSCWWGGGYWGSGKPLVKWLGKSFAAKPPTTQLRFIIGLFGRTHCCYTHLPLQETVMWQASQRGHHSFPCESMTGCLERR